MSKAWDITPPSREPLTEAQIAIEDLLFSVEWTLTTYSNLDKERRQRLLEQKEIMEMESKYLKDEQDLINRLKKDW
jgi:hypothetical protein